MRNVTKALTVLSVAAAVALPAVAAQPSNSGTSATAPSVAAPVYAGPYAYGPYYGPYAGPGYWGGPYGHGHGYGHGGGRGRVNLSFDFEGLADGLTNGWAPWRGWWW
jgi:hypothetical protein